MKVLVCGGRDFNDRATVKAALDPLRVGMDLLIEGGAAGADSLASQWATDNGIHVATVFALWRCHGKAAGPRRNHTMLLLQPDTVVAFPGGRGTAHMVKVATEAGIPIITVTPPGTADQPSAGESHGK